MAISTKKSGPEAYNFFDDVHDVARLVPHGRVTTYGAIARYLGINSARAVGWAMKVADSARSGVPAHRVVNSKGVLSGKLHFGTPTMMQELLERENVKVENDTVLDFERLFWDPSLELSEQ
jgi:methylated-DNA-protein-cysteine methyltransferase related protein